MNEFYNPMECAWGTRCYLFPTIFFLIFQGGGETTPLEQLNMCFVPTLISHFCHFHCFYLKKSSELAVAGAWKIKAKWTHCMPPSVKTYVYYCLLNRATQVIKFLGIMKWLYLGFITWHLQR